MSEEYFNPEIITKIEENTEKLIKGIIKEQKKAISEIDKETDEKIAKVKDGIIEDANKKADAQFLKEKAKQELDLRLKITKFRDELVDNFIAKATEKIKSITENKEYEKSLENLINTAAITLNVPEIVVYCREQDKNLISKQFLANISEGVKKENKLNINFSLSNDYITGMGGVVLETSDGKISINNTYEKRIERALNKIKRELSLMLAQEEG